MFDKFLDFFVSFFLEIFFFLPLFIISCVFLLKAKKRKNVLQLIIFSVCLLYTGYRLVANIPSYIEFRMEDRQIHKYEEMDIGDTATMKGFISFKKSFAYQLQDSLFNLLDQSNSNSDPEENYIYLSVNTYKDDWSLFPINMPSKTFQSLKEYLNYEQQLKDTNSFKLTIKIKKTRHDRWVLKEIIKIDSANKIPLAID